ncbi:hypothetical protein [Streptomyces sp. NPDC055085]
MTYLVVTENPFRVRVLVTLGDNPSRPGFSAFRTQALPAHPQLIQLRTTFGGELVGPASRVVQPPPKPKANDLTLVTDGRGRVSGGRGRIKAAGFPREKSLRTPADVDMPQYGRARAEEPAKAG